MAGGWYGVGVTAEGRAHVLLGGPTTQWTPTEWGGKFATVTHCGSKASALRCRKRLAKL